MPDYASFVPVAPIQNTVATRVPIPCSRMGNGWSVDSDSLRGSQARARGDHPLSRTQAPCIGLSSSHARAEPVPYRLPKERGNVTG